MTIVFLSSVKYLTMLLACITGLGTKKPHFDAPKS
ncbi:hypothetical protein MGAS9429_Spy1384 [Streptococcus pyogenes MGAS9429]|uniref:Uncharacterized protein n=1 Tax=Streptococcus pyogenes serotype M12 (strain MGAS9429) TaxID=370551 RepID=Q1JKJ8_STRPC|nr:hypothetical protein MGAS9429_Spy1384 [Streptococcus pyogenes MGAS9429]BAH82231.1 truncated hypothetical protein [Streptococcus dysgalactiae subsp. equisimilis GGS_124]